MIYAVKHNQVNRRLYKDNEDSLTASIFERLMYLPKELVQHIIEQALFDSIPNLDLRQLESIEFWPHWDATDTGNARLVEPDVFIRTTHADVIIEAKRYDKGQQLRWQWENQVTAYYNEYEEDGKIIVFIALGGLHRNETEMVYNNRREVKIYKCSWTRLLEAIKDVKFRMETSYDLTSQNSGNYRILGDLILCFALYGFSTAEWFERFLPPQHIKTSGIKLFSKSWIN